MEMDTDIAKLRAELDEAYAKVRELLDDVRNAFARVEAAQREDDIEGPLKDLEDAVHKARTGGVLGSGAKGHTKAREALEAATQPG